MTKHPLDRSAGAEDGRVRAFVKIAKREAKKKAPPAFDGPRKSGGDRTPHYARIERGRLA
ncbi:MAG: hypothetical protein AAGF90_23835 [Pseudomonadota bacterium]